MEDFKTMTQRSLFSKRHIGNTDAEISNMLKVVGCDSLDAMVDAIVPKEIRLHDPLNLPKALAEEEALDALREIMSQNQTFRSHIGLGYYPSILPPVILRNVLENPAWYTAYTPYQPEISQGRLEALFNFQTFVSELTGLPLCNASLLDEATAAAEAIAMVYRANRKAKGKPFLVSDRLHPQTIDVIKTRCHYVDIEIKVADVGAPNAWSDQKDGFAGVIVAYPDTYGRVDSFAALAKTVSDSDAGGAVIAVADLLALTIFKEPAAWGADIAVGSTQRFGIPLGFGGPSAAFLAASDAYQRHIPGRIVGQSLDADGGVAWRLALQTREQHIRRQKATSNICTSQVLLANIAVMYAIYHGPEGLKQIAKRIHLFATLLRYGIERLGFGVASGDLFDTLVVTSKKSVDSIVARSVEKRRNFRRIDENRLGVSLDETTTERDLLEIIDIFGNGEDLTTFDHLLNFVKAKKTLIEDPSLVRQTNYLTQEVFHQNRSETEMLRYLMKLQRKDYSLANGMIPLGSCTMKLNATSEMLPLSWRCVGDIHPFAPQEQTQGYQKLFKEFEAMLAEITGFDATSLQPNSGAQGEYSGMLAIRRYLESIGEGARDVCLIPESAHGTNPASAAMAGMKVVVVKCNDSGELDVASLKCEIEKHQGKIAAAMITYPSTHGVFEPRIKEVCQLVHDAGGQVYLDGANMNAQVGLARPGDYGADVVHLNLHKTFAIPHGGGGPGVGPICVKKHLQPFLPGHQVAPVNGRNHFAVSSAPYGSASICTISWMYIRMLGAQGLKKATQVAILNANYVAKKLNQYFPVLYHENGFVAHEVILDPRRHKVVSVSDIAKRLIDYGFHAPTISFPVPSTLMFEPTESESKGELDRFCDAIKNIFDEIEMIEKGEYQKEDNPLVNAPHTAKMVCSNIWKYHYDRERAAFPPGVDPENKYWPPVRRIDEAGGDRNLICTCPPIDSYHEEEACAAE